MSSRSNYVALITRSRMEQLIEVAKTGCDKAGPQRCGIMFSSSSDMRGLGASNPMVGHQDALMESSLGLAWNVIATRASSMCRHTAGFPCMLAGLLHPEEAKANATWQTSKELVEAFEAAGTKSQEKLCQIVASSP